MANRTWHLWFGFSIFIVYSVVYFWHTHFEFPQDALLVSMALIAALGSEVPDIDQVADKVFHHRDWFTHSPILSTLVFILAYQYGNLFEIKLVAYVVTAFLVTNASHFFLDLFPVWKGSGDRKKGTMKGGLMAPARWFIEGLSGDQIYEKLEGTYRIHLPFAIPEKKEQKKKGKKVVPEEMMKTLPPNKTRAWLVLSGLVSLFYAVLLLNLSIHFLPI